MVCHNNGYGVDATARHDFIDPRRVANALNEELHGLPKGLGVLCEEDVSVVAKEQAEAIEQDHCFAIFKLVHVRQVVRAFFQEFSNVVRDHPFEVSDQVFALGKNVGHDGKDDEADVSYQHGVAREKERLQLLPLHETGVEELGSWTLQRMIDRTTAQVSDEGD